jgi:hypothetical protein
MFPASMLAQLFVKGSLKNTDTGFEFKLKNIIDSGTLVGLAPLGVDETSIPPEAVTVKVGEKVLRGDQISNASPLSVRSYIEIFLSVAGEPLSPGSHKLSIQVTTREAGKLAFSVNENIL